MVEQQHHYKNEKKFSVNSQNQTEIHSISIRVPDFVLIREYAVRLNEFFWKAIGQTFHNVGAHAGARTAGNRMANHKTFQTIAAIRFTINDIEYFLMQFLTLAKARRPIIAGTTTIFR